MMGIINKIVKKAESIEDCKRFLVTAWSTLENPHFANFEFAGSVRELEQFLSALAVRTFNSCGFKQDDISIEKEDEYYQMTAIGVSVSDSTSKSSIKFYAVPETSVPTWNLQFLNGNKKEETDEEETE